MVFRYNSPSGLRHTCFRVRVYWGWTDSESHAVVSRSWKPMDYGIPLSMEFSRQEYRSGSPFPFPGDLPDSGIEPGSPPLQADSLCLSQQSWRVWQFYWVTESSQRLQNHILKKEISASRPKPNLSFLCFAKHCGAFPYCVIHPCSMCSNYFH